MSHNQNFWKNYPISLRKNTISEELEKHEKNLEFRQQIAAEESQPQLQQQPQRDSTAVIMTEENLKILENIKKT